MGLTHSPIGPSDGLVLCLDTANKRSYPGSGTSWFDLSGNGNHGTLTNGPTLNTGLGGGMSFDGVNDYVNILDSSVLNFGINNFTVTAWVRTTDTNRRTVCSKYDYDGLGTIETGWYIDVRADGKIRTAIESVISGPVNYRVMDSIATVNDGIWHHVALQRIAQNTINVFIDGNISNGTALTNGTVVSVSNTVPFTIAQEMDKGVGAQFSQYFLGNIDDIRMYSRALTPAEIRQLFEIKRRRYL